VLISRYSVTLPVTVIVGWRNASSFRGVEMSEPYSEEEEHGEAGP